MYSVCCPFPSPQPFLLGKARVPFRRWLTAGSSSRVEVAVIGETDSGEGSGEGNSDEKTLGKLVVCVLSFPPALPLFLPLFLPPFLPPSLTPSLPHSLTPSLTHSLTHSLPPLSLSFPSVHPSLLAFLHTYILIYNHHRDIQHPHSLSSHLTTGLTAAAMWSRCRPRAALWRYSHSRTNK